MPTAPPTGSSPYAPSNPNPVEPDKAETRGIVRGHILFATAIFLLLALAYHLRKELEIIYVSALFAVVLMPIVNRMTNVSIRGWKPQRWMAIVVLIVVLLGALAGFFVLGLPPVISGVKALVVDLPSRIPMLLDRLHHIPFASNLGNVSEKLSTFFGKIGTYLVSSLPAWFGHAFDILTTIFLSIYFMLEGEHAYNFFLTMFPAENRRRLDIALKKGALKMSKWLIGQGSLMVILGVLSTAAYGVLHVRYYLLLGILTGLLNFIPIIGAMISIALAGTVAAFDSWTKMLGVFIFYFIYENLENAYLTPRIMRSSVNLMGLTVLVALLLGTALDGIVGALVAVPTAALVSVLLEEYAIQR